jgi:hypothetical protein
MSKIDSGQPSRSGPKEGSTDSSQSKLANENFEGLMRRVAEIGARGRKRLYPVDDTQVEKLRAKLQAPNRCHSSNGKE